MDSKEEPVFSSKMDAVSFKGIDVRHQPPILTNHKCIWCMPLYELANKSPEYTDGDCLRIRVDIVFTVTSGGTPPAAKIPLPTLVFVSPESFGPNADEYLLKSCDGRRFRVKKQLLTGNEYFGEIVKAIKDPKEGATLCFDGETLESVIDFLRTKRVMSLALSKKVLIAANVCGLKELEMKGMTPFVTNPSIEKAAEALAFGVENNIASLRDRIVSLVPCLLRKITGANAAKGLLLSVKMENPVLRKKALDVIARGATEFLVAGGIEEIASVPGLAVEVRKAAAEYMATNTAGGNQDETPAKKAKTTP